MPVHEVAETADPALVASDLGPLAWVLEELRRSLDGANKSLKRFVRETAAARGTDIVSVDDSQLRMARQHLHQAVGALEMVGEAAPAQFLRAMEAATQQFVQHPDKCSDDAAMVLERASFALIEYLDGVLAGRPVSPVGMFPQYREVQALTGSDRVHPADLWSLEWRWVDLPPMPAGDPLSYSPEVRARLDQDVLKVMKNGEPAAASELSRICLGLAQSQSAPVPASFWKICAGFFDALGRSLLASDAYVKRAASRILIQYASLARGDQSVSEQLAQDLLFFCARALPGLAAGTPSPLAALGAAYNLAQHTPVDYEIRRFGQYDPALLVQARKRIEAVKETWSSLAGGEVGRLPQAADQLSQVVDSLNRLVPKGAELARALTRAIDLVTRSGRPPAAELGMEVATSVLYLEAVFEDLDPSDRQLADRMARLATRLEQVAGGAEPPPLESWMEELYRRVSDKQTMGTVVGELRVTLSAAEKVLDQFFRNPAETGVLHEVPGLLSQMRGVLSVLGLDQASQAVLRMRDNVDHILVLGADAHTDGATVKMFDHMGNSLGALGFLIDMLNYQPALAKKLFVFDGQVGELRPVMGRASSQAAPHAAVIAAPAAMMGSPAAPSAAAKFSAPPTATAPKAKTPPVAPSAKPAMAAAAAPAKAAAPADDDFGEDDLRGIFLEEAREVVETGRGALKVLASAPDDLEQKTTLRRAFHTLKGSSRMVGLVPFGEAAWSMEQLLNTWLADQKPVGEDLWGLCEEAFQGFARWIDAIAARDDGVWRPEIFSAAADALRLQNRRVPLALPEGAPGSFADEGRVSEWPATMPGWTEAEAAEAEASLFGNLNLDLSPTEGDAVTPAASSQAADIVVSAPVAEVQMEPAAVEPMAMDMSEVDFDDFAQAFAAPAAAPVSVPTPASVEAPTFALDPFDFPATPEVAAAPAMPAVDAMALDMGGFDLSAAPAPAATPTESPAFDLSAFEVPSQAASPAPVAAPAFDLSAFDLPATASPPVAAPVAPAPVRAVAAAPAAPAPVMAAVERPVFAPRPVAKPTPAVAPEPVAPSVDEQVKVIGSLTISIPLYNVYLNEADEWSRRLVTELSEWALESNRPVPEAAIGLAHSLAGSSATVGFMSLSGLARRLELALEHAKREGPDMAQFAGRYLQVAEEMRYLLHQFAAGFLKEAQPAALETVGWLETVEVAAPPAPEPIRRAAPVAPPAAPVMVAPPAMVAPAAALQPAARVTARPAVQQLDDDIDLTDAVDVDLFPIFEEEAAELLPKLGGGLRQWASRPDNASARVEVLRALHTLKGSARLAGAFRLGEMAHRMESDIERLGRENLSSDQIEPLLGRLDELEARLEVLRNPDASVPEILPEVRPQPVPVVPAARVAPAAPVAPPMPAVAVAPVAPAAPVAAAPTANPRVEPAPVAAAAASPAAAVPPPPVAPREPSTAIAHPAALQVAATRASANQAVRVRTQLLDRLVNQAGEVMITRSKLEAELGQLRGSLQDLTGNLERLRQQLRDIELQSETQMQSRLALTRDEQQNFDPLEFDRFTRVQELTRMMAESVNDVATVQRNLQRTVEATEDDLLAQARQTRELQRDLLRTRMVEFEGISERLYRVVRQSGKDTGKLVKLDITGGAIEMDRGVLDRMTPAFEHILRNCVAHGIESADVRVAAGKEATGAITIELRQEGNDVSVEFRDDGAGLNLERIRAKAVQQGLIGPNQVLSETDAANLIFMPGFSTATEVSELSGRGIGMDVVRTEVQAVGGRIETRTLSGQGTIFTLILPLTTAVTQVVLVRAGDLTVGLPANLVELVRRTTAKELQQAYNSGTLDYAGEQVPFFWSGALLQASVRSDEGQAKGLPVIIVRSAAQRVAMHVDQVLGNQEVVVKNLGPQLARLPGLAGMTVLASGAVVLIYNPVALASVYGTQVRALSADHAQPEVMEQRAAVNAPALAPARAQIPLVLVVDDSITVRRVTQRMLQREGYRVALAADGLQALERLREERPSVVLSDIEMPRMDGFDLARNIKADAALADLPIIMITSRIAEKHREHAREIGVNHYLGKPFSEEELLSLLRRYAVVEGAAAVA